MRKHANNSWDDTAYAWDSFLLRLYSKLTKTLLYCSVMVTVEQIFVYHDYGFIVYTGEADPLIVYRSGEEVAGFFKSQKFKNHTFKSYPGVVHTIDTTKVCNCVMYTSVSFHAIFFLYFVMVMKMNYFIL